MTSRRLFVLASVFVVCFQTAQCEGRHPATEHMTVKADEPVHQVQYDWIQDQTVYQYAQESSFSLLAFDVPLRTWRAEFQVTLDRDGSKKDNKTVLVSLRRSSFPVVQLYNETLPDRYTLPKSQQSHYLYTDRRTYTIALDCPTPGRVYMAATVLNPIDDIIQKLQWNEPLEGVYKMNVRALYTLLPIVTSLDTDLVTAVSLPAHQMLTMSFRVPAFTMSLKITLTDCRASNTSCPIVMTFSDSLYAGETCASRVDCSNQGQRCLLRITSPRVNKESYLTFSFYNASLAVNATFNVSFEMEGCQTEASKYFLQTVAEDPASSGTAGDFTPSLYRSAVGIRSYLAADDYPLCVNQGLLGRGGLPSSEDFAFNAVFALWTTEGEMVPDIDIIVPDFTTEVRTFRLQDSVDGGGILALQATLMARKWTGILRICAMAQRMAENGSLAVCPDGALLELKSSPTNHTEAVQDVVYLPFPAAGTWYLSAQSQCFGTSGTPAPCTSLPMVTVHVNMNQCVPDACGQYGQCKIYTEATTVFAACECLAGYRGLLCNDETFALTKQEQLRAVYLLTFSNLAFIPAIVLAVYRRYFTLAAIFFFNFFFSTFYHACDASHVFQLCIRDYDTLQFCDFLGSVLSFWGLLLTMARMPETARNFLLVSGAMVIALFQNDDRFDAKANIAPIAVAGASLIATWAVEMTRRRALFPSKKRYLYFLLPGAILALSGILVKFLVKSNASYQYGHSYWHFAVMIAPCLLMPPLRGGSKGKNTELLVSIQDILRADDTGRAPPPSSPPQRNGCREEELEPALFDASMNSFNSDRQNLIA